MSFSAKTSLAGVENFHRQIQLMNAKTRARTQHAIAHGTHAVVAGAKARAPKQSGELASTIRAEFSKNKLIGWAKAGYGKLIRRSRAGTAKGAYRAYQVKERRKAAFKKGKVTSSKQAMGMVDLGVYAPVVERGDKRRHHSAHPFMIPAFKANEQGIKSSIARALQSAASETERALK